METKKILNKQVIDSKQEYKGDKGKVTDIRVFEKAQKTYAVIQWDKDTKHGNCYRNYKPDKFGMFKRFKVL